MYSHLKTVLERTPGNKKDLLVFSLKEVSTGHERRINTLVSFCCSTDYA